MTVYTNANLLKALTFSLLIGLISCKGKDQAQSADWKRAHWQEFNDEISIAVTENGVPDKKNITPSAISYKLIWESKPRQDAVHATLTDLIERGLHTADSLLGIVNNGRPLKGFVKLSYRMILEEEGKIKIIILKEQSDKDPDDTTLVREITWLGSFPGVSDIRFVSKETRRVEFIEDHPELDATDYPKNDNHMPTGYDFMLSTRGLTEKNLKTFNKQIESGFRKGTNVGPSSTSSDVYTYIYEFNWK